MRRAAFFLLALSFSGLACFAQDKPKVNTLPPLNPQEIEWDFGRVKPDSVVSRTFVLKNEFTRELNIKDVTTSCGCTQSEVKKRKLSPGETSEITVKFDSKGYASAVKQFVYIFTDNFGEPAVPANPSAPNASSQEMTLSVDGKPILGIDNSILRIIIKADVAQ